MPSGAQTDSEGLGEYEGYAIENMATGVETLLAGPDGDEILNPLRALTAQNSQFEPPNNIPPYPSGSTLAGDYGFVPLGVLTHASSRTSIADLDLETAFDSSPGGFHNLGEVESFKPATSPVSASNALLCDASRPSAQIGEHTRQRKRRRLSGKLSSAVQQNVTPESSVSDKPRPPAILNSAATFVQRWNLPALAQTNRVSRIILGQLSALQHEPQEIKLSRNVFCQSSGAPRSPHPPQKNQSPCSERPVSYPQSQRWRKSIGLSIRTLRDEFEKMKL